MGSSTRASGSPSAAVTNWSATAGATGPPPDRSSSSRLAARSSGATRRCGRPVPVTSGPSVRVAHTSPIPWQDSRRPTNSSASREARSNLCRSSTRTSTEAPAASVTSRLSAPAATPNVSTVSGADSSNAAERAAACGAGMSPNRISSGLSNACSPANGSATSASVPVAVSTCRSVAAAAPSRSRAVLPLPASPMSTNAPPNRRLAKSRTRAISRCSASRPTRPTSPCSMSPPSSHPATYAPSLPSP